MGRGDCLHQAPGESHAVLRYVPHCNGAGVLPAIIGLMDLAPESTTVRQSDGSWKDIPASMNAPALDRADMGASLMVVFNGLQLLRK